MPIHFNIDKFNLSEQIRLIESAGHKVRFILPDLIEHKSGNIFGIMLYLIIFDEKDEINT